MKLFALLMVQLVLLPLWAATLLVPSQFPTINTAMANASSGDTILVGPGTYHENVFFNGVYVWLESTDGPTTTIIEGTSLEVVKVFNLVDNPSFEAGISGFTIRGGNNTVGGHGGGITVANGSSDFIVENNIIENNYSELDGGGILINQASHCIIRNNTIRNNEVTRTGAGIYIKLSNPQIIGNTITNNIAQDPTPSASWLPSGGGILITDDAFPVITGNIISLNHADHSGGGVKTRTGVAAQILDNQISENTAAYSAGIHCETDGTGSMIADNQIHDNRAEFNPTWSGSGKAGGIGVWNLSIPTIDGNNVYDNFADFGGGGVLVAENANPIISNNQIYGNSVRVTPLNQNYSGGGLHLVNASATIYNNVLCDNEALLGGGVILATGSNATFTNNAVINNRAFRNDTPAAGGGVFINQGATLASVSNNIFAANNDFQVFEEHLTAVFHSNLISDDGDGMFFNYDTGAVHDPATLDTSSEVDAQNTFSGDPGFISNTLCEFVIDSSSPGFDEAHGPNTPLTDIFGTPRPQGAQSDIGAVEVCPSQLGDWVFHDLNGNGIQNAGEPGLDSVTVELFDSSGLLDSVQTTGGGFFLFEGLAVGTYHLKFTLPNANYFFSPQDQGGDDDIDSDVNSTSGETPSFSMSACQSDLSWDCGIVSQSATIGDLIWLDQNTNGIQDAGEPGLGDITVSLYNHLDVLVEDTASDPSGFFEFTNLAPGTYYLQLDLPTCYEITLLNQGSNGSLDNDFDPVSGTTSTFTLVSLQSELTLDAGLTTTNLSNFLPNWPIENILFLVERVCN